MTTLIETGDSLGRPEVIAVVRHDSAPLLQHPAPTSVRSYLLGCSRQLTVYRSQLLAGMLAAAHGVSDFFPGDGAELKSGEMRPECVQPLSFQRRYDNQTWAAGPLPRARCPPFRRVHGLSGVFAAPGGHEFTVQEELP
mgnify:CR=1 FL=1